MSAKRRTQRRRKKSTAALRVKKSTFVEFVLQLAAVTLAAKFPHAAAAFRVRPVPAPLPRREINVTPRKGG